MSSVPITGSSTLILLFECSRKGQDNVQSYFRLTTLVTLLDSYLD